MPSIFDPPGAPSTTPQLAMRGFDDVPATRTAIFDNVLKAAQGIEPVANPRYTLALADLKYSGPEKYSLVEQKKAILGNRTLNRRLQGTWQLSDTVSGKPLAAKTATLAHVPWMTDRGTFIHNGVEYTMANQFRLLPGVFTRRKANGELEAHVNVAKGLGHRLALDPETGTFQAEFGQAKLPLYPLLKTLGVTDQQLRDAWGNDLTAANMLKDDPQAVRKLYAKLLRYGKDEDDLSKRAAIVKAINQMELDPEVTKRTLGKPYKNVSAEMILDATRKLLAVNKGEADEDDRDHLAYQRVLGPEDLFSEAITRARGVSRNALWKASGAGNLDRLTTALYTPALQDTLLSSGLGMPNEEVNMGEVFDQLTRITRMGRGGIPSLDAVPDESRAVHPSQYGFVDFLRSPESSKVGIDLRLARGARKGSDGRIYTQLRDLKTGQLVYKSPQDIADDTVAFPGELEKGRPHVWALVNGKPRIVPRQRAAYAVPSGEDVFSPLGNLVPMKSAVKGQRAVMAARMITQALPLTAPEAPWVQSGIPGQKDRSYEDEYGSRLGAIRFGDTVGGGPGRVLSVDASRIVVQTADGKKQEIELHQHQPLNRKTFYHQTPVVRVGDTVQPGQLLATSNFTNPQGVAALGKNARVAYVPWGGLNFEDAVVVSKSFAERMQSEHMYQHGAEWDERTKRGKAAFTGIFPAKYPRKTLQDFDAQGVIKPGTKVEHGSPLILVAREREPRKGVVHRSRGASFSDETVTWDHREPGVVTDVEHTDKGVAVVVKTAAGLQVGDKLSGRYGDKGVVAAVIDDHEMPANESGEPFEVLLNPSGVTTRTNPAQIHEAALGKLAARRGQAYKVQDFSGTDDLNDYVERELQQAGLQAREAIVDPRTGRRISDIYTGNRWLMKLHHTAESKYQGRGLASYTAEETPAKGGPEGAKRVGMLELSSLLSHGATDVIRDISTVRGQANPQYWSQYMAGFTPPTPKVPHVYQKFVDQLRGAGMNVIRNGRKVHLMAMRDRDLAELTGDRELQNVETVDWRDFLKPIPGGLFDPQLTGGPGGNRWSHITLQQPLPNPVMEEPIRRLLGLTTPQFEDILAGKEQLAGETGPQAIAKALGSINIERELERARLDAKSSRRTARDQAVRKLKYLKAAQQSGTHPNEWLLSKVPVLPPAFRPVSTIGAKKLPLVADPNYLYKEVFEANKAWKDVAAAVGEAGDEQLTTYKAFKAVTGLGDPIQPKNQERRVRGILEHVFGSSPKTGTMQYRLLGRPVDLVGRAVIAPDPDLDMDQVGIPENRAWEIYRPFLVRRLVRRGMPRLQAARAVEARSTDARQALLQEMEARPVIINRAPTLHRYGVMAAWPRLVKGDVLKISPLVVKGFNADFDGDAMQFHVPASEDAVQEAVQKMLPSRNLFSTRDYQAHYTPLNEYIGGLYEASARVDNKPPHVFSSRAAAIRAYREGRISLGQPVAIAGT